MFHFSPRDVKVSDVNTSSDTVANGLMQKSSNTEKIMVSSHYDALYIVGFGY
jgi:hypothetical protein